MKRYGLRDDQFARIETLLPGRPGMVGRSSELGNRLFVEAVIWKFRSGVPWRDLPERFGDWEECPPAVQPVGQIRCLEAAFPASRDRCRQRIRDHRQHHRARPSAQRRRERKAGEDQAIGRSSGGLSTKINALVDALATRRRSL